MKTDKNSRTHSTTSGAPSQPEQAVSDNNPRNEYEIQLHLTEYKYATVIIEAASLEEAEEMADEIEVGDDEWRNADRDAYVYAVKLVEKGEGNE